MKKHKDIKYDEAKHYKKLIDELEQLHKLDDIGSLPHLNDWRDNSASSRDRLARLSDTTYLKKQIAVSELLDSQKKLYTDRLMNEMGYDYAGKRRKIIFKRLSGIAAAVIFISFIVYGINKFSNLEGDKSNLNNDINPNELAIISSTGEKIVLNDYNKDSSMTVNELNNVIANHVNKSTPVKSKNSININRLIVPKQMVFNLILADGSEVMLNANSSIEYPSEFDTAERRVKVSGEVFFNVKKSNVPFIVENDKASIRVYGTKFTVNSNGEDFSAVLINGSVGVTPKNEKEVMIKPSEKIIVMQSGDYEVKEVDVNKYTDWTRGEFVIEKGRLGELIEELSDWHGINIGNLDEETYNKLVTVHIEMDLPIYDIIIVLEKIIGKQIIYEGGGKYVIE